MALSDALLKVVNFELLQAANAAYSPVLGPWWIILTLTFIVNTGVYGMTKKPGALFISSVLGFAVVLTQLPTYIHALFYLIAVIGFTGLLYKVFGGKE
jgi:hypothetical protein